FPNFCFFRGCRAVLSSYRPTVLPLPFALPFAPIDKIPNIYGDCYRTLPLLPLQIPSPGEKGQRPTSSSASLKPCILQSPQARTLNTQLPFPQLSSGRLRKVTEGYGSIFCTGRAV